VDIDEYTSIDRVGKPRPFDFARLKDDVSIGRVTVGSKPFSRLNTLRADGNSRPAKRSSIR
jgi:hypothetical protein